MTNPDGVLVAEDRFFGALLAGNGEALRAVLTPDFVLIEVMTGSEIPGSVLVDLVGGGQLVFDTIERVDSRVRAYGAAVGVVTGQTRMRGRYQDELTGPRATYSSVRKREASSGSRSTGTGPGHEERPQPSVTSCFPFQRLIAYCRSGQTRASRSQ